MNLQNTKAFTLVELIVVIAILAILGTIGFISFQGYSRDARDSTRISDIRTMEKALSLYHVQESEFPLPQNGTAVTYTGETVWTQGIFGEETRVTLSKRATISKAPVDPLTLTEYTYSVLNNKQEYQLGAILEGGNNTAYNTKNLTNQSYAASQLATAYIKGNYNGVMAKVTKANTDYVLAVPTIINGDMTLTDIIQIMNQKKLVYNGYKNLPSGYTGTILELNGEVDLELINTGSLVVYSGSIDDFDNSKTKRALLLKALQNAFSGTTIANKNRLDKIITATIDTQSPGGAVDKLAISEINYGLKKNIPYGNNVENYWAKISGGGVWIQNINIDINGNIYIGGWFQNTVNIFGTDLTSAGANDGFLVKLDGSGNIIWLKQVGGTGYEWIYNIDTDFNGNIYVGGTFQNTVNIFGTDLTSAGANDGFLVKLDSSGNILWVKQAGGDSYEWIYDVKVDSSGYVYISGYFYSTANIFGTNLTSAGANDGFLAKLDNSGNTLWVKKIGGNSYDYIINIILDTSGNVYTGGWFLETADIFGTSFTTVGAYNSFLAKLDGSGNAIWIKQIGGNVGVWMNSVFVDAGGNIYIGGYFLASLNMSGTNLNSVGGSDGFLIKLDNSGNVLWAKQAGGTGDDYMKDIKVNINGNIYLGGSFQGTADVFGTSLTSKGADDGFLVKLGSSGNATWVKQVGGNAADGITSLAVKGTTLYINGYIEGTISVFGQTLSALAPSSSFIAKTDSDGNIY